MGVPGDDGWTLDLLVRGGETPSIVSVYGEGANLDVIELEGTVASLPDNMVLPLAISLSDLDSQRFDVQEQGGGNWRSSPTASQRTLQSVRSKPLPQSTVTT